ncbi:MAG: phosphatase PAP2 family protein [Longimicrobiales bacterium]
MTPPFTSPDAGGSSFVRASAWLSIGVPAVAMVLLAWVELAGENESLFRFFNGLPHFTGSLFWANVTILGDGLVCAVLFLPWIRRHPERVWGGVLGALAMVLILRFFKGTLSLPRPLAVLPQETLTVIGPGHRRSSFPSGHTATAFLFVGIWALSSRRRAVSLGMLLPGILVGISRMAVGVHWPSDVLAGAALGWTTAWLGLRWAARMPWGMGRIGRRVTGALLLVSALVLLLIDHTGYPGVLAFQRGVAVFGLAVGGVEMLRLFHSPGDAGFPPPNQGN